jgi:hypothetical protein
MYKRQETRFMPGDSKHKGLPAVPVYCTAAAETVQTFFLIYQNLRVICALSRAMATVETAEKGKSNEMTSEAGLTARGSNKVLSSRITSIACNGFSPGVQ